MPVSGISLIGRATQGVKLINLEPGDKVVRVARVVSSKEVEVGETVNGDPKADVASEAGAADELPDVEASGEEAPDDEIVTDEDIPAGDEPEEN
jgi:DNA gyrase subunit A